MIKKLPTNGLFLLLLFVSSYAYCSNNENVIPPKSKTVTKTKVADINEFTMQLTPVDETCTGNGQIVIDIDNTEPGAVFEFQIYQLPNTSVPIRVTSGITATGSTLSHTETSLPDGEFMIIASQVVGVESNQQTENVTIVDNIQAIAFNLDVNPTCGGGEITVNVTAGNPAIYELRDTSNNVVVPAQPSNVITAPYGDYTVVVTDICGNATSLGVTLVDDGDDYSLATNNGVYGFWSMSDCNTIRHIDRLRYGGDVVPAYKYPIQVERVIENPTGGADTVINITWNSSADVDEVAIPFYEGESYEYSVTFTDACGEVFSFSEDIDAEPTSRLRSLIAVCGTKFLQLDNFKYYRSGEPMEVTFVSYPTGFDPADYNSNFIAGAYTHTFNGPQTLNFGNSSSVGVPDGDYTIEIASCGRTETKTITVSHTSSFSVRVNRYHSGCGDNEGSIHLYIRSSAGSQQADDMVSINITSAPADFIANYGALPYDVSYNIATNGRFYMNSLPAGEYTVEVIGSCGMPLNQSFTIYDKNITSTVTPTFNCGSFNVEATISSYLGNEVMWLQKYYPESGQWGHPTSGTLYTEGNQIGTSTGISMNTPNNNSGYQTYSGVLNNLVGSGQYRVIVQSYVNRNGEEGVIYCREVLDTFNVPATGVTLNNYYVANCVSGNTELIIDADGVAPLNYTITAFNGVPMTIDNGTSPVFSELAAGEYTVEIEDGCANVSVFQFKTDVVKTPVIKPSNLCDGENGTLSIIGLPFLDIEWTKDSDPTVIGTGNTLDFTPFDEATDAGTYYAHLSYGPNPNACITQTLSFEVQAPAPAPEAGTGQTVNIAQLDAGIMNLFDYVTGPYDNYGEWVDLSNTGALNNEVLNASSLTVGTYQFQYEVEGPLQRYR